MENMTLEVIKSWNNIEGNVNTTQELLDWIKEFNEKTDVSIQKIKLEKESFWFYDSKQGSIHNKNSSFFYITGIRKSVKGEVLQEQPIIVQNEIGYLGIICKMIDGVLNFLMQAKIEPGNVNKVQVSPTIQATKSNFTQKHGGKKPRYLECFINVDKKNIIVDQIQSEQSSRFYKKRNRNIIIKLDEDIEVPQMYKWMTLGQIKQLMKIDNIVNMDTRTVLSCLPFVLEDLSECQKQEAENLFNDKALFKAIYKPINRSMLPTIYQSLNNYKMFENSVTELILLNQLEHWVTTEYGVICKKPYNFRVIFCDIAIQGREVERWQQPLFEAIGKAIFGLFVCEESGEKQFLVHISPEIGCFDKIEIGPSVQLESLETNREQDNIVKFFLEKLSRLEGIKYDVVLSEEGGRFYHEQNRNVIIQIKKDDIGVLPEGYFWVNYYTLNLLVQINNCLNIQLRNLLSLLEV